MSNTVEEQLIKRKEELANLLKHKKELQASRNVLNQMSGIEVLEFYENEAPKTINILMKNSLRARTVSYVEPYSRCKGENFEEIYSWIVADMKMQEGQIFYFWCEGFWVKIKIIDLQSAIRSLWEHDVYNRNGMRCGITYGFLLVNESMDCIMEAGSDSRDEDNYLIDIYDYSKICTDEDF